MTASRRNVLGLLTVAAVGATASASLGQAADQWFPLKGDDGKPVANLRLPVELTGQVDAMPGLLRIGSATPDVTLVEFFDYNCPYCRKAAKDLRALVEADRDLRIVLVNNAILSPMSAQAAKVALAVLKLKGTATAAEFNLALFDEPGKKDGLKALDVAKRMGVEREQLEQVADSPLVGQALVAQMRLAAALGFSATPSFIIGGAGVLGYPGPKSLRKIISAMRSCDQPAC
jgi:protein-disulfide isomerase